MPASVTYVSRNGHAMSLATSLHDADVRDCAHAGSFTSPDKCPLDVRTALELSVFPLLNWALSTGTRRDASPVVSVVAVCERRQLGHGLEG